MTAFIVTGLAKIPESLFLIIGARGLQGIALGLGIPGTQVYVSNLLQTPSYFSQEFSFAFKIAESSDSNIRGALGGFPQLFMSLGSLMAYVSGAILPWHFLAYYCALFPLLLMAGCLIIPESPVWLANNNMIDELNAAKKWLMLREE